MKKLFFTTLGMCIFAMLAGCQYLGTKNRSHANPAFGIISFDNTTVAAAKQLSDAFLHEGEKQNIKIYRGTPDGAQYFIKGYFSVVVDDKPNDNTVLYVFDIVDKNGARMHRVEGKYILNRILTPAKDGFWASISKNGYDAIAMEATRQLALWLTTNRPNRL